MSYEKCKHGTEYPGRYGCRDCDRKQMDAEHKPHAPQGKGKFCDKCGYPAEIHDRSLPAQGPAPLADSPVPTLMTFEQWFTGYEKANLFSGVENTAKAAWIAGAVTGAVAYGLGLKVDPLPDPTLTQRGPAKALQEGADEHGPEVVKRLEGYLQAIGEILGPWEWATYESILSLAIRRMGQIKSYEIEAQAAGKIAVSAQQYLDAWNELEALRIKSKRGTAAEGEAHALPVDPPAHPA